MSIDSTSNSLGLSSASRTAPPPVPGPSSRSPRHVQWASKPQVEHVEQISHSHSDEEDHGELPGTLDEHGADVSRCCSRRLEIPSPADVGFSSSPLHLRIFIVRWKAI